MKPKCKYFIGDTIKVGNYKYFIFHSTSHPTLSGNIHGREFIYYADSFLSLHEMISTGKVDEKNATSTSMLLLERIHKVYLDYNKYNPYVKLTYPGGIKY